MPHRSLAAVLCTALVGCTSGIIDIGAPTDADTDTDTDTDLPCEEIPWYPDADGDRYGRDVAPIYACEAPDGAWANQAGDCDDRYASIHPDAPEQCNDIDDDCDGEIDNGVEYRTWWLDADGDGYAGAERSMVDCEVPEGWFEVADDCDDNDPTVHPYAVDWPCDGVDGNCDGEADGPAGIGETSFATIQSALNAAQSGDVVLVCPGVWSEALNLERNVDITLTSYSGTSADTVLTGGGTKRILYVEFADLTVSHLSFTEGNGYSANGGAISAYQARGLTLSGLQFSGNIAQDGGAVAVASGTTASYPAKVAISDCSFTANHAEDAGGGFFANLMEHLSSIEITDSQFDTNSAGTLGGGVGVTNETEATLSISSTTFDGNSANSGGGISLESMKSGYTLNTSIVDCTLSDNTASSHGGGVRITGWGPNTVDLQTTVFEDNTAGNVGGGMAIGLRGEDNVTFQSCTIQRNEAANGGAIGGSSWGSMTVSLTKGTVDYNNATSTGGAIYLNADDGVSLSMNTVYARHNKATEAAAIFVDSSAGSASTSITNGRLRLNASSDGTAAVVVYDSMTSTNADYGEGTRDNSPADLSFDDVVQGELGAGETFTCSNGTCE